MNARSLLWSNAVIAFSAAGCVVTTLQLAGTGWQTEGTAFFTLGIVAATWCAYHGQRFMKSTRVDGLRPDHLAWHLRHRRLLHLVFFLLLPLAAWPLIQTGRFANADENLIPLWSALVLAIAIVALYAGLPGRLGARTALRRLPGLKMVWIGFTWAIVTSVWPLHWSALQAGTTPHGQVWWMAADRFLVIAALTLPFDLRDRHWDHQSLRTWPQWLGPTKTRMLALFLLLAAGFMRGTLGHGAWLSAAGLAPMVAGVLLAKEQRPASYFLMLDALLLVDAVWLTLALDAQA